jgi:heme oxygenase (mycobilin-producing)
MQFDVRDDEAGFLEQARAALRVLAERPGYLKGHAARATDDPTRWVLVTEWLNVGSYRRALGSYDVKLYATELLARAIDEPSAFEPLLAAEPGADPVDRTSDLAPGR